MASGRHLADLSATKGRHAGYFTPARVIYTSGTHTLPQDTKYRAINVGIQLLHPDDPVDTSESSRSVP